MALSLQEQLLKAGLTNKKKANQVRQQKNKQAKAQKNHNVVETNEAKLACYNLEEATVKMHAANFGQVSSK